MQLSAAFVIYLSKDAAINASCNIYLECNGKEKTLFKERKEAISKFKPFSETMLLEDEGIVKIYCVDDDENNLEKENVFEKKSFKIDYYKSINVYFSQTFNKSKDIKILVKYNDDDDDENRYYTFDVDDKKQQDEEDWKNSEMGYLCSRYLLSKLSKNEFDMEIVREM